MNCLLSFFFLTTVLVILPLFLLIWENKICILPMAKFVPKKKKKKEPFNHKNIFIKYVRKHQSIPKIKRFWFHSYYEQVVGLVPCLFDILTHPSSANSSATVMRSRESCPGNEPPLLGIFKFAKINEKTKNTYQGDCVIWKKSIYLNWERTRRIIPCSSQTNCCSLSSRSPWHRSSRTVSAFPLHRLFSMISIPPSNFATPIFSNWTYILKAMFLQANHNIRWVTFSCNSIQTCNHWLLKK